eukprot:890280-Pyramimonas_sp.AAC.1
MERPNPPKGDRGIKPDLVVLEGRPLAHWAHQGMERGEWTHERGEATHWMERKAFAQTLRAEQSTK